MLQALRCRMRLPELHFVRLNSHAKSSTKSDIFQYNKESLVLYGPLVNSPVERKRKYKPLYYKDRSESSLEFYDESLPPESSLPKLNIFLRDEQLPSLNLQEMLAHPLASGYGVDERLFRIAGQATLEQDDLELKLPKLPSVTAILDKTMPEQNRRVLERWKREQVEVLGEQGFADMQRETLATGHHMHSCLHAVLSGQSEAALDMTSEFRDGLWSSVRTVLPYVRDVRMMEQTVLHDRLHYTGIVDCVAVFKNTLCVIDWKTSRKRKFTLRQTYDNPIQLAAYAGAINTASPSAPMLNAVLVYAYTDGSAADVHHLDNTNLHKYWYVWLQRLQTYWKMVLAERANEI